jgi:lysophospholipase L1-like esterase
LLLACASNDLGRPPDASPTTPPRSDGGVPDIPDSATPPAVSDAAEPSESDAAPPPAPTAYPLDEIDQLSLYIIVGDSVAAGYDATGRNGEGGHGFARLVYDNHPSYPDHAGHDLSSLHPGCQFVRVAESGATSADALSNLRSALGGALPESVPGDVLVSINVGGNDFNDDIRTIIDPISTAAVTSQLRANLAEMFSLLRARYEDREAGKTVTFLVQDVHDPTDDTGSIPAGYDDGFCSTINNPLFIPALRTQALTNLGTLNTGIHEEVVAQNGVVVPFHDGFLGHGMNATSERWLSNDCTHPTDEGHDALRRIVWETLTGDRY